MNKTRTEIRLAGTGGQGLITAGIILAEAAIYDGKNVVQSQSYGPEARGGASKAEVIIAEGPIYYPKTTWVDILLAMSQKACDQYLYDLTMDGIFIADTTNVTQIPTSRAIAIPITGETRAKLGRELFSNRGNPRQAGPGAVQQHRRPRRPGGSQPGGQQESHQSRGHGPGAGRHRGGQRRSAQAGFFPGPGSPQEPGPGQHRTGGGQLTAAPARRPPAGHPDRSQSAATNGARQFYTRLPRHSLPSFFRPPNRIKIILFIALKFNIYI